MSIASTFKKIVSSVAPTLGVALGGPYGGMAVKAIAKAVTGNENLAGKALAKAVLQASPEQLAEIKKADQAFELKMAEIGVDLKTIAAEDRASARAMQEKNKSWIVPILAGFTVAAFFGVVAWVLTGKVSLNSTLLGFVLGQVSAKAEQVYNFYFGSSEGSKRKTEQLNGGT